MIYSLNFLEVNYFFTSLWFRSSSSIFRINCIRNHIRIKIMNSNMIMMSKKGHNKTYYTWAHTKNRNSFLLSTITLGVRGANRPRPKKKVHMEFQSVLGNAVDNTCNKKILSSPIVWRGLRIQKVWVDFSCTMQNTLNENAGCNDQYYRLFCR